MTLEQFIEAHRREIDSVIYRACPHAQIDDEERELWVLNDEGLYNFALEKGVEI